MHSYCILLLLFSLSLSCFATNSNTFVNDADYQKLSPSPTYFVQQGGYADENNVMWVDSAGILRWIGADDIVHVQNLRETLPNFSFNCTRISSIQDFLPSAFLLYSCDKTTSQQEGFFICHNYQCGAVINATQLIVGHTPSGVAFVAPDNKGIVSYSIVTRKQFFIPSNSTAARMESVGEFCVITYTSGKNQIIQPSTGYQVEKAGMVLSIGDVAIIDRTTATIVSRDTTNMPFTVDFPGDVTKLTLVSSLLLKRCRILRYMNIQNSQLVIIAYLFKEQRFVQISCPEKQYFLDWNSVGFNDYRAYDVISGGAIVFDYNSSVCTQRFLIGNYRPLRKVSEDSLLHLVSDATSELAILDFTSHILTVRITNLSDVTVTKMPVCTVITDVKGKWEIVYASNWYNTSSNWTLSTSRIVDNKHAWLKYKNNEWSLDILTGFPTNFSLSGTVMNSSLPKAELEKLKLSFITKNIIMAQNNTYVLFINDNGLQRTSPNSRYVGLISGSTNNEDVLHTVTASSNLLYVNQHIYNENLRTFLGANTSLNNVYSVIVENRMYIATRASSGDFMHFYIASDYNNIRSFDVVAGFTNVSHSNTRLLLFGETIKSGFLYNSINNSILRVNYTGTASTTFGFASKSGIAAFMARKDKDTKMAVYMPCDTVDDCKAVDSLTYSSCVNNTCQYLTCPVHTPFLCPRRSAFPCASSLLDCLV